jgi:hypothetical protein
MIYRCKKFVKYDDDGASGVRPFSVIFLNENRVENLIIFFLNNFPKFPSADFESYFPTLCFPRQNLCQLAGKDYKNGKC